MSMKLTDILPAPSTVSDEWSRVRRDPWFRGREEQMEAAESAASVRKPATGIIATREPPPYGKRTGFVPRTPEDFGDGGAFPEISMAQFPLGMGVETQRGAAGSGKTVALQFDADGKLRHDAIARIGQSKDKIIYSKLADAKARIIDEDDESFHRPDEEKVADVTDATRRALEKITTAKVDSALPVRHAEKQAPAQYIRYTPSQQAGNFNSGAQQRIIRMVEAQVDPMEPPKFKINQKIPRAPPSPPAPVMHSPTRKVTVKEQADWKIPPCISNWKNPKGFTIALDKRLAADGRGLQQVHINENFAKLAESLYIADRKAREAVEMRAQMERRVAQNKKAEQEEKMRQMAQKARQDRAGIARRGGNDDKANQEEKEREAIRRDRLDDRRKERNMARNKPEKLERMRREKERDISEKIALGLPDNRARDGETQFDQRLFNQSKGLDSGGIDDESFAVYDKPWRPTDNIQQHLYRPSKNLEKDIYGDDLDKIINTNKFVPDRGFTGADASGGPRAPGPVQFEREEDDPFGLGQLLQTAREGKKRGGGGGDDRHDEQGTSSSSKRSRK